MGICIENLFVYILSTCWCAHGRSANSPVRAWPARGRVRRWDKIDFPTTSPTWLWSLITPTRIYIDIVRLHRYPMYICIYVQYADTARGWSWKIRLFVSARQALYKHTDGVFISRTTHTTYVCVCESLSRTGVRHVRHACAMSDKTSQELHDSGNAFWNQNFIFGVLIVILCVGATPTSYITLFYSQPMNKCISTPTTFLPLSLALNKTCF